MKIIIGTTEYPPYGAGIANVVYNLVEELNKEDNIECIVCSPSGPDVKLGSNKLIKRTGIIGLLFFWLKFSRYIRKRKFDVVWMHNPFVFSKLKNRNKVITMHSTKYGNKIYGMKPRTYYYIVSIIEKICLNRIKDNAIFTGVGKNVCQELIEIGIEKDKIVYILNGVNTNKFQKHKNKKKIRNLFRIPKDKIILLNIGRVTDQKQPLKLLDFFSRLEKLNKRLFLVIAGSGNLLEKTKEKSKELEIQNIRFLGYIDEKDKPLLYSCSDYFIVASKYEGGQPILTLAEAMSSGLPSIVSDIKNLKIVEEIDAGIVIDFNNIEPNVKKVHKFLLDSNYESLSKNAIKYVKEKWDWQIIIKKYIKIFFNIKKLRIKR